jgi:hypothetical protein
MKMFLKILIGMFFVLLILTIYQAYRLVGDLISRRKRD